MVTARKATGLFVAAFISIFAATLLVSTPSIYATDGTATASTDTSTQSTTSDPTATSNTAPSTDTTTQTPSNTIPLEITPLCSDATNGLTSWKVVNKNDTTVNVMWQNLQNNVSGSYDATKGESTMLTSYDKQGGNNTTRFTFDWQGPSQTNAPGASTDCNNGAATTTPPTTTPTPVKCVDGTDASNLIVSFPADDKGQVILQTKGRLPVCESFKICFSSYLMPTTWDGVGNSASAYPQSIIDGYCATVVNGAVDGYWKTELPKINWGTICDNVQLDLYYPPLLYTLGQGGHGDKNIASEVYAKSSDDCTPGMGGGGGIVTPPTTTPPSTPITTPVEPGKGAGTPLQMPTEIPATGVNANPLAPLYTMLAAVAAYGGVYLARRRSY